MECKKVHGLHNLKFTEINVLQSYSFVLLHMATRELIFWQQNLQPSNVQLSSIKPLTKPTPPQALPGSLKYDHHWHRVVVFVQGILPNINLMPYVPTIFTNPQEGVSIITENRPHIYFQVSFLFQIIRTKILRQIYNPRILCVQYVF